jgi:hypothetical protein
MKFAMVTAHTSNYNDLAELTWDKNKKRYCERWGYDAIAKTDDFKYPTSQISFERTELIIKLLESGKYDWIHAVGCDTMITNFTITLESLVDEKNHFIIASDCLHINNDSFLARATPECINWLKYVVSVREKYVDYVNAEGHRWFDQQAMIDSLDQINPWLKVVPQRVLNSYDYYQYPGSVPHIYKKDMFGNDGQWQKGDFLIHWPAIGNARRRILAQSMLQQVIE